MSELRRRQDALQREAGQVMAELDLDEVSGMDIYDAVLNHGVRAAEEFDAYLHDR